MGYKIVGVFEFPSSDSNADAEDAFWKTVGTGDIKELKERNTNWKFVKTDDEGGSFSNVAKTQVKRLIFGAGQSTIAVCDGIDPCKPWLHERLPKPFGK